MALICNRDRRYFRRHSWPEIRAKETLRVLAVFYVLSALVGRLPWNWDALLVAPFSAVSHRRLVCARSGVFVGACSGPEVVAAVGMFQIKHRDWNPARLSLEFWNRRASASSRPNALQFGVAAIRQCYFLVMLLAFRRARA